MCRRCVLLRWADAAAQQREAAVVGVRGRDLGIEICLDRVPVPVQLKKLLFYSRTCIMTCTALWPVRVVEPYVLPAS